MPHQRPLLVRPQPRLEHRKHVGLLLAKVVAHRIPHRQRRPTQALREGRRVLGPASGAGLDVPQQPPEVLKQRRLLGVVFFALVTHAGQRVGAGAAPGVAGASLQLPGGREDGLLLRGRVAGADGAEKAVLLHEGGELGGGHGARVQELLGVVDKGFERAADGLVEVENVPERRLAVVGFGPLGVRLHWGGEALARGVGGCVGGCVGGYSGRVEGEPCLEELQEGIVVGHSVLHLC